jgi:uncharacterized protein (UPF0335 family)
MSQLTKQQRVKIEEIIKRKFNRVYSALERRAMDGCEETVKQIRERHGVAMQYSDALSFLDAIRSMLEGFEANVKAIDNEIPHLALEAVVTFDVSAIKNCLDRMKGNVDEQFKENAKRELIPAYGLDKIERFEEDALDSLWLASAGADVQNLVDQVDRQLRTFIEEATEEKHEVKT